jgi:hypothetical protein
MSRTIVRYGPEDIDHKDPVHGFLMGVVLVAVLKFTGKAKTEDPNLLMDGILADILNMAADSGISITKAEIPAVFPAAFFAQPPLT